MCISQFAVRRRDPGREAMPRVENAITPVEHITTGRSVRRR
jgi:hypothetical protein